VCALASALPEGRRNIFTADWAEGAGASQWLKMSELVGPGAQIGYAHQLLQAARLTFGRQAISLAFPF